MLGFKGLIPRNALAHEAMEAIIKKAEEHRKISQLLIEFYRQIVIFQQSRSNVNQKMFIQTNQEEYKDPFNKYLWNVLIKIIGQHHSVFKATKKQVQESSNLSNKVFSEISAEVTKLEQSLQNYREYEDSVFERSKKYYKIHKSMLTAIEQYKTSFSDVNLIYNLDEKIRRYQNCQFLYNYARDQYQVINDQCQDLFNKKKNVTAMYNSLLVEFQKGMNIMSLNSIEKGKQFMYFFAFIVNNIVTIFKHFQRNSRDIAFQQIFKDNFVTTKLEYYDSKQQIDTNKSLPLILQYHALLKEQHLRLFNTEVPGYLKLIQQRLKMKRIQNKKIFQVVSAFMKNLQKTTCAGVKQILVNFQKNRKRLSQYFGNRLVAFLKSINSVFELLVGIHEKMSTQIAPVLLSIQNILNEEGKIVKYFTEEINTNTQRFLIKRYLKKQQIQQESVQAKQANLRLTRKQISQKAEFTKHLISGFQQKMDKNTAKLINAYGQLMYVCGNLMGQFHSFCEEYFELYFGEKQIKSNLQKYQVDFENTRNKNKQQYYEFQLNVVSKDTSKIVFEGDFNKIEDFKKIKKPAVTSVVSTPIQNANNAKMQTESNGISELKQNSSNQINVNEKVNKNIQFLQSKIVFKPNQKYIDCYSCALVQKITLQGKMYLTTQRVCFHSNFNSNNLFFGKTFIQFPKTDIKKIQKKQNILDNSISFTTINGQILFTNIFSRNEVYDKICKNFSFSLDDHVYQYEENQVEELPEFLIDNQQKDDIKMSQLEERAIQIDKLIPVFPYMEASNIVINEQSLNALKIFKIFYHTNQISYGNKKYENFLKYYKEFVDHKDVEITQWEPPLNQILNQSNIKENAPFSTKRTITATIPINTGGVPFMPKTALSLQYQTLYFFSKHKFVIYSNFQTRNAPYVDTFRLELKTTVSSNDDGECKFNVDFYVNFIKNTMMKAVIQSKSKQETTAGTGLMLRQIKRFFEVLHSKPKKGEKKSVEQLQLQLEAATADLQSTKQQNVELKSELTNIKKTQKILQVVVVGSLVLNFMILLLFIL